MNIAEARAELDALIDNARGQHFKPIHVAEILHHDRMTPGGLNLLDRESYRCASKRWRDEVCERLVGTTSRSNGAWQDIVLSRDDDGAALSALAAENRGLGGVVEAYIYRRVGAVLMAIAELAADVEQPAQRPFSLAELLRRCREDASLRRVVERVYEIVAYAVIDTLIDMLGVRVSVDAPAERLALLAGDDRFLATVLRSAEAPLPARAAGRLARVGVMAAADGGLDVVSNFDFRAQVRHTILNGTQVQRFFDQPNNPAPTLICREARGKREEGAANLKADARIIAEADLVRWSDLLVSGRLGPDGANKLRARIVAELRREFPGCRSDAFLAFMRERGYDAVSDWTAGAGQ